MTPHRLRILVNIFFLENEGLIFHVNHLLIHVDDLGPDARKPVFWGFANNTGADQPAHFRSLISAFVILT